MDQTTVIYVKFLCDVACQKLLKLVNVSRSYSKNNTGTVFLRHGVYSVVLNLIPTGRPSRKWGDEATILLLGLTPLQYFCKVSVHSERFWFSLHDEAPQGKQAGVMTKLVFCQVVQLAQQYIAGKEPIGTKNL